jgi:hypothetical protein
MARIIDNIFQMAVLGAIELESPGQPWKGARE